MSFPKLNDFITKGTGKAEYKRVSLIHSIKNSLTRNTIVDSCKNRNKPHHYPLQSAQRNNSLRQTLQNMQPPSQFKYEQKMPASFTFSTEDMYKLLEHLFNKKQQDLHDRNFIRRLMLKHFPEQLICAGGRDFVSLLKFDKLRKGEHKIFDEGFSIKEQRQQKSESKKSSQKFFYFILKGKVRVFTEEFTYRKASGQYFGELEILGNERILQIQAKSDTMLLYLGEKIFTKHLAQYFINIYSEIRKKISLFEPILNLAPLYNQYKFLEILSQKQYKTGDKIYQKGDEITEIVLLNYSEISSTEDKLLNQFKAVGLGEVLGMQRPRARETTYCMDNKIVYVMKAGDLTSFIDKNLISSFVAQNYNFSTLNGSKVAPNEDQRILNCQKNVRLDTFVNIKRVRFTGNKRRVLTEPNLSISMSSPTSSKQTPNYPEYATSFVFIKQNTSLCFSQLKSNRLRSLKCDNERRTDIKEYLLRTRDSFKKKRWLDEIDTVNESSIIYNPEKMAKYQMIKNPDEIKEFVAES